MNHRLIAALALAAGLACNTSTGRPGLGLSAPAAVAVFNGLTSKNPDLHPYVAIANGGKDELVLVDALDDQPVIAPVVVRALSIPVTAPRPARLVSASLGDVDANGKPMADLLVAVSAGSSVLQVVNTWGKADGSPDPRVMRDLDVDLAGTDGADVLALVAAPVPVDNGDGTFSAAKGRVRIVAALSGQRIAVVEYKRVADGPGIEVVTPLAPPQDLAIGGDRFEAVALAVNPAKPQLVYAASLDPIPVAGGASVLGVAEIDMSGAPGTWTWRGLDARAPTTAVAAWHLQERQADSTGDDKTAFEPTAVDRVYAVLDSSSCGAGFRIDCGIAVLDPVTGGIPADPASTTDASGHVTGMPYLAPINVPAVALGVVVSPPPQVGPTDVANGDSYKAPYMRIAPGTGQRTTTAVAAVLASDGKVYYADLGRWSIPNDTSMLRTDSTRTRVTDVTSFIVSGINQAVGLWDPKSLVPDPTTGAFTPKLVFNGLTAEPAVKITPGFTRTDGFLAAYQGFLPGLSLRKAELAGAAGGRFSMSMQIAAAGGFTQVVRLYSPELGVHRGDIALVDTTKLGDTGGDCPVDNPATTGNEAIIEARVAEFVVPDATHPGGALLLEDPADPSHPEWTSCITKRLSTLAAPVTGVDVGMRASGFVVQGTTAGYVGRAEVLTSPSSVTDPNDPAYDGYRLLYENEDVLSCPLVPWPADPTAVDCRDDACRAQCERLVLARKARRIYYPSDACNTTDCSVNWPNNLYPFPKANGPVLAFKLGVRKDPDPAKANDPIPRELSITIKTRSGLSPSSRGPTVTNAAQILPTGAATFDRSVYAGKENDGYRFYASYASGFVLDFSPSQAPNQPITVR
ncbi:hypothetical protein [Anaeromyxobacter oryzae]|uniref:Lipoprotein n=1 Tax=Anaeromyxobacter oryzae TaxID=2918170 RepID=A0ABM7X344_9BACT|nr:hypothetical protein [Anaeromyxobacter oryzae]BDG06221.1 hypothetical protein AMOR_52170 [Anaeromyxobacter oryzae]